MPAPRPIRAASLLLAALALGLVAGCAAPLLTPDEPRSQYDRYDAVRGQSAAPYVEDEFGRRYPNLRGRLMTRQ